MNKIYLSQKQAKLSLRAAGFSVARAAAEVEKLVKITDGKREKVKRRDVERIIADAAQPTPLKTSTIRPCIPRRLRV